MIRRIRCITVAAIVSFGLAAPQAAADTLMPVWFGRSATGPAEPSCFIAANAAQWRSMWTHFGFEQPFDLPEQAVALSVVEEPSGDCTLVPWLHLVASRTKQKSVLYYRMIPNPEYTGPADRLSGSGGGTLRYEACTHVRSTYPVGVVLVDKHDSRMNGLTDQLTYARLPRLDTPDSELVFRDCRAP
jgi:hypothetical protein